MAPMKRPAAASLGGVAKKPAGAGAAVSKKCRVVADAVLSAEGLPKDVLSMLSSNIADCLGVAKEDRHPYQEKVISMVGEVLKGVEASIEGTISEEAAKVGSAETEKASLAAAEEAAGAKVKELEAALDTAKTAKTDAAAALKSAKEAEKAADGELKAATSGLEAATTQKTKLESALNEAYMPMKESGDESKHGACMAVLNAVGEEFELNASLLTSLSSALAKPPDARGSFDGVCLKQVEDELTQLIGVAGEKVAAAEATKTSATYKVSACQTATTAAATAVEETTAKAAEAQAAAKEGVAEHKETVKALKAFGPQMKQVEADLEGVKADLQSLRDGALAAFAELLERSAIPPPAPEPVEEAPAEEAPAVEAPAVEEAA